MDQKIANSILDYIETLYYLNKNFLQLCGVDYYNDIYSSTKLILDVIQDIPRLIPYSYDKGIKKLKCKDKDGLLEYQKELDYLKTDYDNILKNNYDFLDKIRKIRNKYEHKMHDIKYISSGGGSLNIFYIEFLVNGESIQVEAEEFKKLIKELNILFAKIVFEIIKWADENNKKEYKCYEKIDRFNFEDFNEIYDDKLLTKIGRLMYPY